LGEPLHPNALSTQVSDAGSSTPSRQSMAQGDTQTAPSRKHSLQHLSPFGATQSLSKFGRQSSYNSSQQNLPGLTSSISGNATPVPSQYTGTLTPVGSRHNSEASQIVKSERDLRGRIRNDSEESFHNHGADGDFQSRESTNKHGRHGSGVLGHRMEREASMAPSFTSLPGDRKRGFAALTGLLKRKPHGSKGEGKVMHGAKNPDHLLLLMRMSM
jgi:hypothetical protein